MNKIWFLVSILIYGFDFWFFSIVFLPIQDEVWAIIPLLFVLTVAFMNFFLLAGSLMTPSNKRQKPPVIINIRPEQ